jgi:outer membrane protein TolC
MKSAPLRGIVALAALLAAAPHAAAAVEQGAALAPPPDSLVALALQRAPSLAALRARVQEAREMVRPAGALPNPMVEVMLQDVGFPTWTVGSEDMSMLGPQVSQGIPFPGKRTARRRVAQAEVAVKESEFEQLRREVARDMRGDYARLYAVDRQRSALGAGHEMLAVLTATVRDRYSAGMTDGEAALKAQLVLSRLDEQLGDLAAERAGIVAAMNRLLDRPGDAPVGEVTALPVTNVPATPWSDAILGGSVDVATRRAEVRAAEHKLQAARLERWPDLVAGAGLSYRGGKDPVTTLRLGLDLPLWSGQNQSPVLRANTQGLEAARQSLREAEAAARADAARLEADWTNTERQVARYAETIVPQSSLTLEAARSGYLVGRGDFTTVIDDFRMWLEARTGLAQREARRYTTWAELQAVLGPGGAAEDGRMGR